MFSVTCVFRHAGCLWQSAIQDSGPSPSSGRSYSPFRKAFMDIPPRITATAAKTIIAAINSRRCGPVWAAGASLNPQTRYKRYADTTMRRISDTFDGSFFLLSPLYPIPPIFRTESRIRISGQYRYVPSKSGSSIRRSIFSAVFLPSSSMGYGIEVM